MEYLIYVNVIGKNSNNEFIYEFYFSDEPDLFWMFDADVKPASICNLGVPEKQMYTTIKTLKSNIIFNVSQKNSCFSMQDCKDGIVPVAWENIDMYEEYPRNGRIVFPFGISIYDLEKKLNIRDLSFDNNDNIIF